MEFNKELFEELLLRNLDEFKSKTGKGYDIKYKILKQFEDGYVMKIVFSGEDIRTTNDAPIMNIIKSNEKMEVELVDVLDSRLDCDQEFGFGRHFILLLKFNEIDKSNFYDNLVKTIDNTCSDIKDKLTDIDSLDISSFAMRIGDEVFDMKECNIDFHKNKIINEIKNHDFSNSTLYMDFYVDVNVSTSNAVCLFDSLNEFIDIVHSNTFYLSENRYIDSDADNSNINCITVDGCEFGIDSYEDEIVLSFSDVERFVNGRYYSFSKELEFGLSFRSFEDLKDFCNKNK